MNKEEKVQELIKKYPEVESGLIGNIKQDITTTYEAERKNVITNEEVKKASKEVVERAAKAKLAGDMIDVMTQEHQNALSFYVLEQAKKKLEYTAKKEKKLVEAEVRANVAKKKQEILKARYGYLYKDDEEFIPSRSYNRHREIANWWNGTSDNFKKIVKGTAKILIWGAILYVGVRIGYNVLSWLAQNGRIETIVPGA